MTDCAHRRRPRRLFPAAAALLLILPSTVAAAEPSAERLQLCGTCHGEKGNSRMEKTPSLAGQPELFLANQLILFRERLRKSDAMEPFVKGIPDGEIVALARHYARLPAEPTPEPVDAALAARGAELAKSMHCGSCHLPNLRGREQMPRIAGQRIDYMIDTLIAYRDGRRYGVDTSMNGAMYGVSDEDIRALAHFAAGVR
jgi:cytochrome c553